MDLFCQRKPLVGCEPLHNHYRLTITTRKCTLSLVTSSLHQSATAHSLHSRCMNLLFQGGDRTIKPEMLPCLLGFSMSLWTQPEGSRQHIQPQRHLKYKQQVSGAQRVRALHCLRLWAAIRPELRCWGSGRKAAAVRTTESLPPLLRPETWWLFYLQMGEPGIPVSL